MNLRRDQFAAATLRLPSGSEPLVLALVAALATTILLKIAGIQYLELLELGLIALNVYFVAASGWRLTLRRPFLRWSLWYAIFFCVALIGAAIALEGRFYLDTAGAYRPGYITLARALELFSSVGAMLILSETFLRTGRYCLFTMRVYFWVGTLAATLSLLALAAHRVGPGPFVLAAGGRADGFYNEGGPFGLLAISTVLVGWVLRSYSSMRRSYMIAIIVNTLAFFASASKAGLAAVIVLAVLQALFTSGLKQRFLAGTLTAVILALVIAFTPLLSGIEHYQEHARIYERASLFDPNNPNLVIGRVAGLYFVPKMIAAHPLLGVGWGNYGLVRNAFQYRADSVVVGVTDSPGLGLYGLAAEIGIPLTLLLIYLLFQPAMLVRNLTSWKPVFLLAMVQPVVHLCGAQLNVTYPWIVSAFAIGMTAVPEPVSVKRQTSTTSLRTQSLSRPLFTFRKLSS